MYVKIGPYKNFYNVYYIADLLTHVGVSEERCEKIGDWLEDTWVDRLWTWINSKRKRKIVVHIDRFDTWSFDNTLSIIVAPALRQLKEQKHGSPFVDDEDVPENLRSTNAPPKENAWDVDDLHHDRWNYVLDEMIWAFEKNEMNEVHGIDPEEEFYGKKNELDIEAYNKYSERKMNGFRLFGKYYQGLWT